MAGKKSWVLLLAVGLVCVLILLSINTVKGRRRQFPWDGQPPVDPRWTLDRERIGLRAERLAKALTFPTISWERGAVEREAFMKLHHHIRSSKYLLIDTVHLFDYYWHHSHRQVFL